MSKQDFGTDNLDVFAFALANKPVEYADELLGMPSEG
jgi:hypothetical protein